MNSEYSKFSFSKKVDIQQAIPLITSYILQGFAVYYNPNTQTLRVTKSV